MEKQIKARADRLLAVENSVEIVDNRLYNARQRSRRETVRSSAITLSFCVFCQYSDDFSQRILAFLEKEFYNRDDQQDQFSQGG